MHRLAECPFGPLFLQCLEAASSWMWTRCAAFILSHPVAPFDGRDHVGFGLFSLFGSFGLLHQCRLLKRPCPTLNHGKDPERLARGHWDAEANMLVGVECLFQILEILGEVFIGRVQCLHLHHLPEDGVARHGLPPVHLFIPDSKFAGLHEWRVNVKDHALGIHILGFTAGNEDRFQRFNAQFVKDLLVNLFLLLLCINAECGTWVFKCFAGLVHCFRMLLTHRSDGIELEVHRLPRQGDVWMPVAVIFVFMSEEIS